MKILTLSLMLALSLSLVACDFSAFFADAEDDLLGDGLGDALGDAILGGENKDDAGEDDNSDHKCKLVLVSELAPTCENEGAKKYKCEVCGETKTELTDILPHTVVVDPAEEPNGNEPGKTEGKHCSACGTVIVKQEYVFASDYSVAERYDGDYAYKSLLELNNAEKLTKLYKRFDEAADSFHNGTVTLTEDNGYVVESVKYSDLGLNAEEAIAAWCAYRIDRPLYYWISGNISYDSNIINLICDADYANAAVRANLNSKIYSGVEAFVKEGYTSSKYNTALAFHDLIILAIDYAYEADGVTPEDDPWAHNIIGVFDKGAGVCESYSKTFQLLLNYCDIENVLVSGYANEAHAWNLIKLDDGSWYWCDLTWDDTPEFMWGISYRYFCVNDTDNVGWSDGPFIMNPATFVSNHTPNGKINTGINYNYELPARSSVSYTGAEIMLKDTFDIGNLTYAVAGYNCVQLVAIRANGDYVIPAAVTYKGETLDVVSVGRMNNGYFYTGSIATYERGEYTEQYEVGSITLPESVILIWDDALNIDSLTAINVDSNNEVYTSIDGVLFTKNLGVIVKYPTSKSGLEYTLPEQTVIIAAGAFSTFYSNTPNMIQIKKLYVTASGIEAGIRDYGYGYYAKKYVDTNAWNEIKKAIAKNGEIILPSEQ